MKRSFKRLNGSEPMGIRGSIITARYRGVWYDSLTVSVKHNARGSDRVIEAVDVTKPLTAHQLKKMTVLV